MKNLYGKHYFRWYPIEECARTIVGGVSTHTIVGGVLHQTTHTIVGGVLTQQYTHYWGGIMYDKVHPVMWVVSCNRQYTLLWVVSCIRQYTQYCGWCPVTDSAHIIVGGVL